MQITDSAFINRKFHITPTQNGPLNLMNFSVKDVFQIKGHTAGLGNPYWKIAQHPARKNALVINKLLDLGATLNGITISDEFMFSIKGSNRYYGDPLNPNHPESYTGGSSSGSASAVAQHLSDFALGTDTGGSIRVPASYCGLFGFRPTPNLKFLEGVAPLSTSFDTVGLLTNRAIIMKKVGQLLYQGIKKLKIKKIYYLDTPIVHALPYDYLLRVWSIADLLNVQKKQIKPLIFENNFNLQNLHHLFKDIQGFEAWKNYGFWISKNIDTIGPDIAEHFKYAATINNNEELLKKYKQKDDFSKYFKNLLSKDSLLILPTTSSTAPQKKLDFEMVEQIRNQTQQLTSIAGLAGTPQLVLPLKIAKNDFSLSIISGPDTDISLLEMTDKLFETINYIR